MSNHSQKNRKVKYKEKLKRSPKNLKKNCTGSHVVNTAIQGGAESSSTFILYSILTAVSKNQGLWGFGVTFSLTALRYAASLLHDAELISKESKAKYDSAVNALGTTAVGGLFAVDKLVGLKTLLEYLEEGIELTAEQQGLVYASFGLVFVTAAIKFYIDNKDRKGEMTGKKAIAKDISDLISNFLNGAGAISFGRYYALNSTGGILEFLKNSTQGIDWAAGASLAFVNLMANSIKSTKPGVQKSIDGTISFANSVTDIFQTIFYGFIIGSDIKLAINPTQVDAGSSQDASSSGEISNFSYYVTTALSGLFALAYGGSSASKEYKDRQNLNSEKPENLDLEDPAQGKNADDELNENNNSLYLKKDSLLDYANDGVKYTGEKIKEAGGSLKEKFTDIYNCCSNITFWQEEPDESAKLTKQAINDKVLGKNYSSINN